MPGMNSVCPFSKVPAPQATYDDYLHRPFVITNETRRGITLEILSKRPVVHDTILGVSCFFTLDMAAIQGTKAGAVSKSINRIIILDRGSRVHHFWERAKKIITKSHNRLEVVAKIKELLNTEAKRYYEGGSLFLSASQVARGEQAEIDRAIDREYSWLSNDHRFHKIQKIFKANRFHFQRVDLFDARAMKIFKAVMDAENIQLDALYLSNITDPFYLSTEDNSDAIQAIDPILSPKTALVSAHSLGLFENDQQHVRLRGKLPIETLLFPTDAELWKHSLTARDFEGRISQLIFFVHENRTKLVAGMAFAILCQYKWG